MTKPSQRSNAMSISYRLRTIIASVTVILLLANVPLSSTFAGKIYKWTDSEGNIHYTDRPNNKNDNQQIEITPGPSQDKKEAAKQREQKLKSTADSLQQTNQQREQIRTEEQKKRDEEAALAAEKAKQNQPAEGQNTNDYGYGGYPRRIRPPNVVRPPVARPLPSGAGARSGSRGK